MQLDNIISAAHMLLEAAKRTKTRRSAGLDRPTERAESTGPSQTLASAKPVKYTPCAAEPIANLSSSFMFVSEATTRVVTAQSAAEYSEESEVF